MTALTIIPTTYQARMETTITPAQETDPFRTITHALSFVKPVGDATTIYVAQEGYSNEENGETFPIVIPDNVHLIGDEAENTILDADTDSINQVAVMIINEVENVYVASMTLTGGYSEDMVALVAEHFGFRKDTGNLSWDDQRISMVTLENLIIEDNHSHNGGGISFYRVAGPSLTDVVISDNTSSFQSGGVFIYVSDVTMNSVIVEGNTCLGITYDGIDDFGHGGGVFLNQSTGQFSNLSILNNNASSMGGGIWSSYGSGWTIENSIISGNMAPWNGGGIALWDNNSQGEESSPTIISAVISNNSATGSWWAGHGGGFWINNSNPHIVVGSDISNNSSNNNGGGFNIHNGSDVLIDDSIISNNDASWNGGGIRVYSDAVGVELNRCLIIQNNSDSGGGVSINGSVGKITNCTIVENNGTDSGGLGFSGGAIGTVVNSIIWQNSPNNITSTSSALSVRYSNIGGGFTAGEGNISEPPIFDAPNVGDYSLGPDSPCIDSGTADLDGDGQEDLTNYSGYGPDIELLNLFMDPLICSMLSRIQ